MVEGPSSGENDDRVSGEDNDVDNRGEVDEPIPRRPKNIPYPQPKPPHPDDAAGIGESKSDPRK